MQLSSNWVLPPWQRKISGYTALLVYLQIENKQLSLPHGSTHMSQSHLSCSTAWDKPGI